MFTLEQFTLPGKVALITGGSRGIGKAIALGFANAGADVVVSSRKIGDLEEVAEEIRGLGRKSLAVAAHAARMDDINMLVNKVVEEFGRIDILVNNAGTNPTTDSALDYTERAWDSVMNLNLKGLFFLSQAAARVMKENGGGSIINIASVGGIRPDMLPVYGISKAGVIYATKVLAQEWAKYNIRVNALAPGLVKTRLSEYLWNTPEVAQHLHDLTPMGRMSTPDEMVGAVIYLCSPAASYVTGQTIAVDGGSSI